MDMTGKPTSFTSEPRDIVVSFILALVEVSRLVYCGLGVFILKVPRSRNYAAQVPFSVIA